MYIFGGKGVATVNETGFVTESGFKADSWYRDSHMPKVTIKTAPNDRSSQYLFFFQADKPGIVCIYIVYIVYLVYDHISPISLFYVIFAAAKFTLL